MCFEQKSENENSENRLRRKRKATGTKRSKESPGAHQIVGAKNNNNNNTLAQVTQDS